MHFKYVENSLAVSHTCEVGLKCNSLQRRAGPCRVAESFGRPQGKAHLGKAQQSQQRGHSPKAELCCCCCCRAMLQQGDSDTRVALQGCFPCTGQALPLGALGSSEGAPGAGRAAAGGSLLLQQHPLLPSPSTNPTAVLKGAAAFHSTAPMRTGAALQGLPAVHPGVALETTRTTRLLSSVLLVTTDFQNTYSLKINEKNHLFMVKYLPAAR